VTAVPSGSCSPVSLVVTEDNGSATVALRASDLLFSLAEVKLLEESVEGPHYGRFHMDWDWHEELKDVQVVAVYGILLCL